MDTARARSFGSGAADYQRYRPEYPQQVADRTLEYAGREVRTALEIGAGTGKATSRFVDRGVRVTATDPDPRMLAELSRRLPGTPTERAGLEEITPGDPYDLVFSAAALHWTSPAGRWDRIAALLRPGGVFAAMGGAPHPADPALDAAAEQAVSRWLPTTSVPSPGPLVDGLAWPASELRAGRLFTDVRELRVPHRLDLSLEAYLALQSTVSAYRVLPDAARAAAFAALAAVLPPTVEVAADVTLQLARRV